MNIFLLKISRNFWFICFIISSLIVLKLLLFNWLALSKGAIDFHKPIAYVEQPIDIWKTGLIQKYSFRNKIKTKYDIDLKIISSEFRLYSDIIFDGEYKISIFDDKENSLITELLANTTCPQNDFLQKKCFKIYLYGDHGGLYYGISRGIFLNKPSNYTLNIENLKGLSTHKNVKFELVVSPLEYNEKIQKRNLIIKSIAWISISIFSLALFKKI